MAARATPKAPKERRLYRREWKDTDNPLVEEARAQTLALQRLQVWLRLAYAMLAASFLLGYWGFAEGGGTVAGVVGAVLCVLTFAVVAVLRIGISHGRDNVNAMLESMRAPAAK